MGCVTLKQRDVSICLNKMKENRSIERWHRTIYKMFILLSFTKNEFMFNNNIFLHLYSAFLGTQSTLHRRGGGLLNLHQCAASTWMMRQQPYCTRTPTTHQLIGGEETDWWTDNIRGILPGLRRRRTGLLPRGPKSSFQMRASFVFHLETKVLESGGRVEKLIAHVAWSPVLSFHSLWWFGVQCHLLVLVHCVFWKPMSLHPFTKTFWSISCFLLLTSFLKMLISFSSRICTCPHCQKHQKLVKWPWCWCAWLASKFTRPEPQREPMRYCQEENEKQETKKCRWAEGHCQINLGFHTTSAVPQTDHLHATPNWGSN